MIRKTLEKAATVVMVVIMLPLWAAAWYFADGDDLPLSETDDTITSFEPNDPEPIEYETISISDALDDSMSTDISDTDDRTEQVYQNERFGRTITADRTYTDRGLDTLTVHVEDDDQDATIELTLDELVILSRGVGNHPRWPPRHDFGQTLTDTDTTLHDSSCEHFAATIKR